MPKPPAFSPSAISRRLRSADVRGLDVAQFTSHDGRRLISVSRFSSSTSVSPITIGLLNRADDVLRAFGYTAERISPDMITVSPQES